MYNIVKYTFKFLLRIFYRIKIEGSVDIPDDKGCIMCANHIHMFDPSIIACFQKRQITFMVKKELVETPFIGWVLTKSGAFPVDRSKGDIGAIKTAIEVLKQNKTLSMFPEGTRHRDGKFRDIKKGAAMIAIKANAPIVPMRIIGNWRLFSKMTLRIGEPIYPEGHTKDTLTEKLRESIETLGEEIAYAHA